MLSAVILDRQQVQPRAAFSHSCLCLIYEARHLAASRVRGQLSGRKLQPPENQSCPGAQATIINVEAGPLQIPVLQYALEENWVPNLLGRDSCLTDAFARMPKIGVRLALLALLREHRTQRDHPNRLQHGTGVPDPRHSRLRTGCPTNPYNRETQDVVSFSRAYENIRRQVSAAWKGGTRPRGQRGVAAWPRALGVPLTRAPFGSETHGRNIRQRRGWLQRGDTIMGQRATHTRRKLEQLQDFL